jgi:hypothetical protein
MPQRPPQTSHQLLVTSISLTPAKTVIDITKLHVSTGAPTGGDTTAIIVDMIILV